MLHDLIKNIFKPKLEEKDIKELKDYEKKRYMEKAKKDIDKKYKVVE